MKKNFLLLYLIFVSTVSITAQTIFLDVKKYNENNIRKRSIKLTCRRTKIDTKHNCLTSYVYYDVLPYRYFKNPPSSEKDLLNILELNGYRCEVYDTCTNELCAIILHSTEYPLMRFKKGFSVASTTNVITYKQYMNFIQVLEPDFVFLNWSAGIGDNFICIKDSKITFLDISHDGSIKTYSFSEMKDWSWTCNPFPENSSIFDSLLIQDRNTLPDELIQEMDRKKLYGKQLLFVTGGSPFFIIQKKDTFINMLQHSDQMPIVEIMQLTDSEKIQAKGCEAIVGLNVKNFYKKKKRLMRICNKWGIWLDL